MIIFIIIIIINKAFDILVGVVNVRNECFARVITCFLSAILEQLHEQTG